MGGYTYIYYVYRNNMTVNHDILIATPLRLVHLIQQSQLDLSM
jgi:superfamily II DNA/RNA helicase